MTQFDSDATLREGMAALKAGDKPRARQLLMAVVEVDDTNETAWLWLAGVMDDPAEQRICLENVLHLNPANANAEKGLQWMRQQHPALFVDPPEAAPSHPPVASGPTIALTPEAAPSHPPIASGSTIALTPEAVSSHPPVASGPTIALTPPAAPAPASAPSYNVPAADGSAANNTNTAGIPDPQPCPACGKPTRLADNRCRACGQSLTLRVQRTQTPLTVWKTVSGVFAFIYSLLWVLGGLLVFIAISFIRSAVKLPLQAMSEAQAAQIQPQIDKELDALTTPLINGGTVLLAIGIVGIVLAIGVLKRKGLAYWLSWPWLSLHFLMNMFVFLQIDSALDDPVVQEAVLEQGAGAIDFEQVAGVVRGIYLIGPLLTGLALLFMGLAWTTFTKQTIRFLALEPATTDGRAHFNRGLQYRNRRFWHQAMVEWERAVVAAPADATFRHALGLLYSQQQRIPDAVRELEKARQLAPTDERIEQDYQLVAAKMLPQAPA